MRVILLWLISFNLLLHGTEAVKFPLRDGWTLHNKDRTYEINNITIPSGVYSDLENAEITESVLFSYNDVKLRWIAKENWTYSLQFNVTSKDLSHQFVILTFDGLDTLTDIRVNDKLVGSTNSMFIRYRFDVKNILVVGLNSLSIDFKSPIEAALNLADSMEKEIPPNCPPPVYNGECHMNMLRKMQASFAWDWGLAAPSMGLWKMAYMDVYDSIIIRDVTYQLIDGDPYSLDEAIEDVWTLKVFAHLETGMQETEFHGVIACGILGLDDTLFHQRMQLLTDEQGAYTGELTMTVKKSSVELWWPNGYGPQTLYGLQVQWEDVRVNEVSYRERDFFIASKTVYIGFRTIDVVQDEMDNGLSFYFKVNGVPIFMKGSNWIPAHILPEKSYDEAKVKELLQATRDANMNMLRVWGGGVYESDYFYSLADEYGILLWHDLMFACAMYPANDDFLGLVRAEVRSEVRRIQHHPSIAIFATNNENEVALRQNWYGTYSRFEEFAEEYRKLYVETVIDEIKKQDPSREVLTSSPSNGNYDGDREHGIGMNPQDIHYGDIHFYIVDLNGWDPRYYSQPRFSSEYGFQSFPAGWREVMREGDDLTELVEHRQHHPLRSKPIVFMIEENLNVNFTALGWNDKIYLSQLSQAMAIKAETEVYRSGRDTFMNTMGALYWQLNDVWVAPSWSSIEYNGNFKILHHWIEQIFSKLSLITLLKAPGVVHIIGISDEINVGPKPMTVKMNLYKWDEFRISDTREWRFNMTPNAATVVAEFDLVQYLRDNSYDANEYMTEFQLINDEDEKLIYKNIALPANFKNVKAVGDPQVDLKIATSRCEKGSHKISLEVKVQAPAIFTHISVVHDDIKKYRLSKNGFMQFEPIQVLQATLQNPDCRFNVTIDHFAVTTLNKFLI